MIKLQDFLDKGYIVKEKFEWFTQRRRLMPYEKDYPKVLEIAKSIGPKKWSEVDEAIKNEFHNFYHLYCISSRGNEVYDVEVYFDDANAQRVAIEKNKSVIFLAVEKNTDNVYSVQDGCSYFDSYGSNRTFNVTNGEYPVDEILSDIKRDREKNRANILNHYNKLLKNTKKEYRERLKLANEYLKDI